MDEDFVTALRSGAREVADQTDLTPVHLIRAQGDQRRRRRAVGGVGLLVVTSAAIGVGIVHFGGPARHGVGPATVISQTPGGGGTSPTAPTAPTSSATESTSVPDCTMAQLEITPGHGGAASGHSGGPLLFRNIGSTVCRLHGYPEVKDLDAHGNVEAEAAQTPYGYIGGVMPHGNGTLIPTVDLRPGQSASAILEALDTQADGSACTGSSSLLVTAPNQTHSISLRVPAPGCRHLQIHPVVPGDTGRLE